MKLAVMQPYLFPYIGYFQLIYAADIYLIYDDVAYIKKGYINRNSILTSNGTTRFTIPVLGASQNKLISDLKFSGDVAKVLKTIEQSYSKAPYFETVFQIVRETLESEERSIASVCQKSYQSIFSYLGIEKKFEKTSALEYDRSLSGQDRLISLCQKFGADCYLNAPGGRLLYSESDFSVRGVELKYIDSLPVVYQQGKAEFVPNLSIIDVLMHCSSEQVRYMLQRYELA